MVIGRPATLPLSRCRNLGKSGYDECRDLPTWEKTFEMGRSELFMSILALAGVASPIEVSAG
jgi:hypothetical protein